MSAQSSSIPLCLQHPHLVALPADLTSFKSRLSPLSPFQALLGFAAAESGIPDIRPRNVVLSNRDFAVVRQATREWCITTGQAVRLADLTRPGVTAPLVSNRVPNGHLVVVT
jgi:hypothetical protein